MTYGPSDAFLKQYRQTGVTTSVDSASPHKLIGMLLDGALERVGRAQAAIAAQDPALKARVIAEAIDIIGGLHGSLNMEAGGILALRLAGLYDYMCLQLVKGNLHDDAQPLDEVAGLLQEIKGAWDAMPEEHKRQPAAAAGAVP